MAAREQSKLSHQTAKRYYDRQTNIEQFKKEDLVYLHDPTYRRGKAKKFSYQFKGPYEIESKISPLIYRIRTKEGLSTVVHINRLKRAHAQVQVPTTVSTDSSRAPPEQEKSKSNKKKENYSQEIPLGAGARIPVDDESSDDSEDAESQIANNVNSGRQGHNDPEWEPNSSHSRQESHSNSSPKEVAYQPRSRPVYGPGQEVPHAVTLGATPHLYDKPENATVVTTPQSAGDSQSILEKVSPYNLRKRV
jgi:hypothetical protein